MANKTAVTLAGEEVANDLLSGGSSQPHSSEELLAGIEALAARKSVDAANALANLSGSKDVTKAARRALFRLQSQGIRPEVQTGPPPEPATRATPKLKLIEARVTSYDPRGTRAIFLLAEKPFTGLISFLAIANDSDGLIDAELTTITKKAFFSRIENFAAQYGSIDFVSTPPDYAHALISRAAVLNDVSKQQLPQDWAMWKTMSADLPAWDGPAPIYRELDSQEVLRKVDLQETRSLAESEFAAWDYDEEQLKQYVTRIETARGGPLVVSSSAQRERERAIVDEATDEIFQGRELAKAKERLEETAYLLFKQGNREAAERCLRAALSVEEPPPHNHPFLRELVVRSMHIAAEGELSEEGGGDEEQRKTTRTESGIILPA